jgi:phage replication O-like protein O
MHSKAEEGFLRISNTLFEALLRARLSGAQWRVLLWVIRYTHGWNRRWTSFTWYRVAKDLGLDRAATYRAGQALVRAGMLVLQEDRLGLQVDSKAWASYVPSVGAPDARQLFWPEIDVVREQRHPLSGDNTTVVTPQRFGCQEATVFRRAKDSSKDIKTYKNRHATAHNHVARVKTTVLRPLAGAAKPVPGKYDGLSQN